MRQVKKIPGPSDFPFALLAMMLILASVLTSIDLSGEPERGGDNEITILTPDYVPIRSPFMVHVSLNLSGDYHIKASLNSIHGKYASRLWNGTNWLYPGTSWSKMPVVSGNFSGFLYIILQRCSRRMSERYRPDYGNDKK